MLPISLIPARLSGFAAQFRKVFKHPAQRERFETLLAGLLVSENRTIAGIHQTLVDDTGYKSLWHFMTDSPWSHDSLREERLKWTAQQLSSAQDRLRVIAIDSTFVHHTGDDIYGVYWFWDYVNHNFCLAQRLVVATYVAPARTVPLGMELYHRGFLPDQKLFLQQSKPGQGATQEEWDEYDSLVETYEQNCKSHRTQLDLAAALVEECEERKIPADVYVFDGAFLHISLTDTIEKHERAWVSRLAKNRLVQLPSGRFDTVESFAKSLPKDVFQPTRLVTKTGAEETYWAFSKNMKIKKWKKLRVVITYDNADLTGEPRIFVSNKLNWLQAQKILQPYLYRGPIEHFFRDEKQEIGLEDNQQRKKQAVLRHWELCFVAHLFLELVHQVDYPEDMKAFMLDSIGQKRRSLEMNMLQSFVSHIMSLVSRGGDPEELITKLTKKRLNRLAC